MKGFKKLLVILFFILLFFIAKNLGDYFSYYLAPSVIRIDIGILEYKERLDEFLDIYYLGLPKRVAIARFIVFLIFYLFILIFYLKNKK